MSAVITPTLFLGNPEEAVWVQGTVPVDSVDEAVATIAAGKPALLPEDRWDDAAEVLRRLGCSDAWVANRIRFAQEAVLG